MRKLTPNIKIVVPLMAGVVLLTLGCLTFRQAGVYTDTMSLWRDTVNKNPDSSLAHAQLYKLLIDQGNITEAKSHLERALQLAPYMQKIDSRVYAALHFDMGLILEKQNKFSDAAAHYQKALDVSDYFEVAMQAHYCLAKILALQGKFEPAREHFLQAIDIARAHNNDQILNAAYRELMLLNEKSGHPVN